VTIAHVENAPDFLAPELQVGKNIAGEDIAKYLSVTAVEDLQPRLDGRVSPIGNDAWQWVGLSAPLRPRSGA